MLAGEDDGIGEDDTGIGGGDALQRERREVISVWSVGRLVNNESSYSFNLIAKVIIGRPLSMITLTTLPFLNLSLNGFTGELPLLTGSCAILDLSNNKFEENLTRILKWGNIDYLN
ncbi:hypothetical protein MTR_8g468790 [Medicago truncatula]|uniref:Uncharacterized protein n=1 Tax=Medicago truncatula TaxID=3880 RepID=A0A072TRH7_MEDTR|nr:hypothetical protein MTR_8g468790 [Medicago truncatula]